LTLIEAANAVRQVRNRRSGKSDTLWDLRSYNACGFQVPVSFSPAADMAQFRDEESWLL
jgi:hypothetical protein